MNRSVRKKYSPNHYVFSIFIPPIFPNSRLFQPHYYVSKNFSPPLPPLPRLLSTLEYVQERHRSDLKVPNLIEVPKEFNKKFFYIRLSIARYMKKTNYKNDNAGSMLCHNNPAAYTHKESFTTLYSTPQTHIAGTPPEQPVHTIQLN